MEVSKAAATTAVLVSPDRHTPLTRIVRALMEEVTNEMMNTSITALRPCCTGSWLRAVPYTTAAVP